MDPIQEALDVLERDYYRAGEVAERLHISRSALSNWLARGKVSPAYTMGEGKARIAFFDKRAIDALEGFFTGFLNDPKETKVTVETYPSWRDRRFREIAEQYELTLPEARKEAAGLTAETEWWNYVKDAVEGGADVPVRLLRSLTGAQWKDLALTQRLRKDEQLRIDWGAPVRDGRQRNAAP